MSKFTPISTSLSPNTERDDIILAEKIISKPTNLINGPVIKKLEAKFKEWLPAKYAYTFKSGRSALLAAIEALNLEKGDEVLLQAYTCAAVPNAIMWAGAKPIYVDIDNTYNISTKDLVKKLSVKTKAIVVQHTFGLPADLKRILTIAKKRNLIVIEDCAHAIGSQYNGKNVGTFGDMSIWSFGRDKVISSITGGMLTTDNYMFSKRIETIRKGYKKPSFIWTIKQLMHPVIMNKAILPTYGLGPIGKGALEILKAIGIIPKAVYKNEKQGKKANQMIGLMPNALAILALHQFNKLKRLNEHRDKITKIYKEELASIKDKLFSLPKEDKKSKQVYLRYTVLTDKAEEIIKTGRKRNIILGDWYKPAIAPAGVNYESVKYDPATCPNAERISKLSLNLPTHINISERDAQKIADLVKSFHKNKR